MGCAMVKQILILAGPNGAGKTTFAQEFLTTEASCPTFLNADIIAAELSPQHPEQAAMSAARFMLQRIREDAWVLYDNSETVPVLLDWGEKR